MSKAYLKYLPVLLVFLFLPSISAGQNEMAPAPADWPNYDYVRKPGELKYNKYGMIDPTPDVVSLTFMPVDKYGFVDWVKAINDGVIAPKDSLPGVTSHLKPIDLQTNDSNILIRSKMPFMPDVIFPHAQHNAWLKCSACHPKIFKEKAGGNNISMAAIWKGQFCGRCHDRVAFPTRNCFKCHSVPRSAKK